MSLFSKVDNVVTEDLQQTRTFATKVSIRFVDLIVTAFGVAAGLAWKDVIDSWFSKNGSLGFLNRGVFTIAVVITLVGVLVTMVRSYLPPDEFNSSAPLQITLTEKQSQQSPTPSPPSPTPSPPSPTPSSPAQTSVPNTSTQAYAPFPAPVPAPDPDSNIGNYILM